MPSYGSLHSPSLRKMEHSRVQYGSRKGISMGNIIGDPFALATISISVVRSRLQSFRSRGDQ
jgi:SHO1 osmosensor